MSSRLQKESEFEATTLGFLWRQFTRPKSLPDGTRLTSEVAIVTGSNVGLGLAASRQLLGLDLAHLIMGVRSQTKGDEAAAQLRNDFPSATISVWTIDMESYDSVRAFSDRCASLPRIDIVILNAGLMKSSYATSTSTQNEITLQVNYLSTALLAILLLPLQKATKALRGSKPPTLTIVGSDLFYGTELKPSAAVLPQLNDPTAYDGFEWYRKTKLLLVLFISRLAEITSPRDVLINVVNPGMTADTQLLRDISLLPPLILSAVIVIFARSVVNGASTYLDAALRYDESSHGSFISEWRIKPYSPICYGPAGEDLKARLWQETMEELNSSRASAIVEGLRCRE